MGRRVVSAMAACAAALGIVVLGGGSARAAAVCEEHHLGPQHLYVKVHVCVTEDGRDVQVFGGKTGLATVAVTVATYTDPGTGETAHGVSVCVTPVRLDEVCAVYPLTGP